MQDETGVLLRFEDFIKFLKDNKVEGDKTIRVDHIRLSLAKHKELRYVNDNTYITFQGLLVCVINRKDDLQIFKSIFDSITKILTGQKVEETSTVLSLYEEVAKVKLSISFCDFQIEEQNINTIHADYKNYFSAEEWQNICLFEYHFNKNNPEILSYEDQLVEKTKYFKGLKDAVNLTKPLSNLSVSNYIVENQNRRHTADILNGQTLIKDGVTHTYTGLHESLSICQKNESLNSSTLVSAECAASVCSGHVSGVHIFADVSDLSQEHFEEKAEIIRSEIKKKHNIFVPEVIFLEKGTLSKYSCENCSSVHKFQLRDEYFAKTISERVLYISNGAEESSADLLDLEVIEVHHDSYCKNCFNSVESFICKPLDWKRFDLLSEWYLEIPLELQILLSNIFINRRSLSKLETTSLYMKNKLSKLYALLEFGLNIFNKNYYGVNQRLNTEELIVNYHAVSTVFSITAQSGATHSLKFENNWLQRRADTDQIYFETFLKKHPMIYQTRNEDQESEKLVSMRECLAIIYLDNLLRYTGHRDPDRGKKQTSQLCTLPMTVKGLPRDSMTVARWHQEGCGLASNCVCMDNKVLLKSEKHLLLDLTEPEMKAFRMFNSQVSCGIGLCIGQVKALITEYLELQMTDAINQLNQSVHSMSLNETILLTAEDLEIIDRLERNGNEDNDVCFDEVDGENNSSSQFDDSEDDKDVYEEDDSDAYDGADDVANEEVYESDEVPMPDDQCNVSDENMFVDDIEMLNISAVECHDALDEMHCTISVEGSRDTLSEILNVSASKNDHEDHQQEITITPGNVDAMYGNYDAVQSSCLESVMHSEGSVQSSIVLGQQQKDNRESFLFQKFVVPNLLCRHPTPAEGKDDDINVLRSILQDVLIKLGRYPGVENKERILFAPDYKIAKKSDSTHKK